jgi:hypothetical protein
LRYPFRVIWLLFFLAPKIAMTQPVMRYADVTVQVDAKRLAVVEVKPGRFEKPTPLPRYRGRFLLRVMSGNTLLEEVHVDLPLLADAEAEDASDEARTMAERLRKGVSVKARVRAPLPEGADHLVFVDGKTGRSVTATLSPEPAPSPGASAAGAPPRR